MKLPKAKVLGHGIVEIKGVRKGPTVAVISNVHGNEPCGKLAAQRILATYPLERGRLILVTGNPEATLLGRRFVDADMNRMFTEKKLGSKAKQQDLMRARYLAEFLPSLGIDVAIDFHSVITKTAYPFVICMPGTEALADLCPMPRIFGWKGIVKGTLCEWLCHHGTPTVVVEAGQHDASASVRNSEKTLLSVLSHHGLITLKKPVSMGKQRIFDVLENIQVKDPQTFAFNKTYASFDRLEPGERIATDAKRTYDTPSDAGMSILMPTTTEIVRNGTAAGAYYLIRERST